MRLSWPDVGRHALRHARALRFYAEILYDGSPGDRGLARGKLESAISTLEVSDAVDLTARNKELGLAHEVLARVLIRLQRFRLARNAISAAKRYLGNLERFRDLDDRAKPPG